MKKELKDYLHLYLGCMVELDNGGSKVYNRKLITVGGVDDELYCKLRLGEAGINQFVHIVLLKENRVKPILRPLSDIKVDELKLLASWSGICSPEDWEAVLNEPYKVKHIKCENTFEIGYNGDLVSRKSNKWKDFDHTSQQSRILKQLLDWHIDLFGLIESGLAIDATTLKENA